jgi:hypothetical protein
MRFMQANNSPLHSDFSELNDREISPTINFVIVSEDLPRGVLAKHLYDHLVDHMGTELGFSYELWPFCGLKEPRLRGRAARDAMEADIIIFAVSGREDLPGEVKTWIEMWLESASKPSAMVMLTDQAERSQAYTAAIRCYLHETALNAGIEFLGNTDVTSVAEEREDSLISNISFRERTPLTISSKMSFRASQQWGLNE